MIQRETHFITEVIQSETFDVQETLFLSFHVFFLLVQISDTDFNNQMKVKEMKKKTQLVPQQVFYLLEE